MGMVYEQSVLRIHPSAIPAIRAVLDESIQKLGDHLREMQTTGYIPEPWMHDSISAKTQQFYNASVMNAEDGPFKAALKHVDELRKVRDSLVGIENEYRRVEGDNSDLWGKA